MSIPLPCSTLAIAVGWWHFRQSRNALTENGDSPHVPISCRLFAPASLIDSAADELLGYVPQFLEASCELLGPYPFKRLDILVLPKCFACMGLKRWVWIEPLLAEGPFHLSGWSQAALDGKTLLEVNCGAASVEEWNTMVWRYQIMSPLFKGWRVAPYFFYATIDK